MKINSEEINGYYKVVNDKIDTYLETWKVSPKNLKKYLKGKKLKSFVENMKLSNIPNIEIIVNDVLEDRVNMDSEMVKKFESFNFEEPEDISMNGYIWNGIGKGNIDHEKILADYFDTSLSSINVIDTNTHKFEFEGTECLVFSEKEVETLKENLKILNIDMLNKKKISLGMGETIEVSKIVDDQKLEVIVDNYIDSNFTNILIDSLELESVDKYNKNIIGFL